MSHLVPIDFTFWDPEGRCNSLDQTQNVESTTANVGKEKHDPNAATKLWTQGSADHVWWSKLRNFWLEGGSGIISFPLGVLKDWNDLKCSSVMNMDECSKLEWKFLQCFTSNLLRKNTVDHHYKKRERANGLRLLELIVLVRMCFLLLPRTYLNSLRLSSFSEAVQIVAAFWSCVVFVLRKP